MGWCSDGAGSTGRAGLCSACCGDDDGDGGVMMMVMMVVGVQALKALQEMSSAAPAALPQPLSRKAKSIPVQTFEVGPGHPTHGRGSPGGAFGTSRVPAGLVLEGWVPGRMGAGGAGCWQGGVAEGWLPEMLGVSGAGCWGWVLGLSFPPCSTQCLPSGEAGRHPGGPDQDWEVTEAHAERGRGGGEAGGTEEAEGLAGGLEHLHP